MSPVQKQRRAARRARTLATRKPRLSGGDRYARATRRRQAGG